MLLVMAHLWLCAQPLAVVFWGFFCEKKLMWCGLLRTLLFEEQLNKLYRNVPNLVKGIAAQSKSGSIEINGLCFCSEFVNGFLLILFARVEHHRGEVGAIGRIWEVLCFKADTTSSWEGGTVLSFISICPVVSVELHTRFGGVNLHCATRIGLCNPCSKA